MQIVDANDFCLRTVNYLLVKDSLEFLIIPVLHIGSEDYYQEISKELDKCDTILFEGVKLKSIKGLDTAYAYCTKRLGLVSQNKGVDMVKYKDKLVHADLDEENATKEWKKIPLVSRFVFKTALFIALPILAHFESKKSFAKVFRKKRDFDDTFWFARRGKTNKIDEFVMQKREAVLFQKIDEQINKNEKASKRIGIIYGAGHTQRTIRYLKDKYNFRIKNSWFSTVFWMSKGKFSYKNKEI